MCWIKTLKSCLNILCIVYHNLHENMLYWKKQFQSGPLKGSQSRQAKGLPEPGRTEVWRRTQEVCRYDRSFSQQGKPETQHRECAEEQRHSPDLRRDEGSWKDSGKDSGKAEECRAVGCEPPEPFPYHMEERAEGDRRALPERPELHRISVKPDRRPLPDCRDGRKVVPDRLSQGRRFLWLSGPRACHRAL